MDAPFVTTSEDAKIMHLLPSSALTIIIIILPPYVHNVNPLSASFQLSYTVFHLHRYAYQEIKL